LPLVVNQLFYEMMNSANQAWTMYPGLTHGAYASLYTHGTPEQKATYLHKMTSGEWTGTMCLTEPHCGTDLGLMRSKAEPQADGTYKITGTKIFISAGEHDLADNIIHLVLARLPDAPPGHQRGQPVHRAQIPREHRRFALGERNSVFASRLEHKMGIKSSATAQIELEGAWYDGWPAQQGHAGHVCHDERSASGRGQPVAGLDRSGVPECAGLCQRAYSDAQPVGCQSQGSAGRPDHCAP
jgi:alkylation response protein AidB-like acyl-CoA dehydrogenase